MNARDDPGRAIPARATPVDADESRQPLPVRMLNEYAYCPRLFHLMHVEGRWADNHYTAEGRHVHRRVDQLDHVLPEAGQPNGESGQGEPSEASTGDEPPTIARSVPLESATLGLTGKLDLVSIADSMAVPVETKRGRVPNNPERSWEPERVQLMAQGLLLREHGYACDHGVLYFAGSRSRVDVSFTPDLEMRTRQLLMEAHAATLAAQLPPPLDDSPKCHGCSLNGICLPDETLALLQLSVTANSTPAVPSSDPADTTTHAPTVRRLYPTRENVTPLYVQEQGAYVGKS